MCQAVLRWLQGAVASAECEEIAFAADVGRRNGSDGEVAGSYDNIRVGIAIYFLVRRRCPGIPWRGDAKLLEDIRPATETEEPAGLQPRLQY